MATQKELRRSVYSFSGNHAARTFIWVVTISRIPDRQTKNPAYRAQILANPASQRAVNSRFPSRYFAFSRIPHRILVKSRIPRIPFQTLLNQTLLFTTQSNPNKLSSMSRFACLAPLASWWLSRDLQASRASQKNGAEETVFPPSLSLLPKYLHNWAC